MNGRPAAAQVHNAAVNCIFSGMSFFPADRPRRRRPQDLRSMAKEALIGKRSFFYSN